MSYFAEVVDSSESEAMASLRARVDQARAQEG